ncbi:unnamed protein product, partial [marine sediment metagenome]
MVRPAGPYLLSIKDVGVSIFHSFRAQGRKIAASLRFTHTDAKDNLTSRYTGQEILLLFIAAVA